MITRKVTFLSLELQGARWRVPTRGTSSMRWCHWRPGCRPLPHQRPHSGSFFGIPPSGLRRPDVRERDSSRRGRKGDGTSGRFRRSRTPSFKSVGNELLRCAGGISFAIDNLNPGSQTVRPSVSSIESTHQGNASRAGSRRREARPLWRRRHSRRVFDGWFVAHCERLRGARNAAEVTSRRCSRSPHCGVSDAPTPCGRQASAPRVRPAEEPLIVVRRIDVDEGAFVVHLDISLR